MHGCTKGDVHVQAHAHAGRLCTRGRAEALGCILPAPPTAALCLRRGHRRADFTPSEPSPLLKAGCVRDPAPAAPTSPHFPAALKTRNSFWLPSGPLLPAAPAAPRAGTPRSTCPRTAQCFSVPPAPRAGCCWEPGGSCREPHPRKLCPARGCHCPAWGEGGGLSGGTRSCSRAAKGWERCCGSERGQR